MKKIGLLGGISAASTQQYYRVILEKYYQIHKDYYYPEIVINSLDFQYFTDLENEGRIAEYVDYIAEGILSLKAAGADFAAMAANSPHSVYEQVAARVPVPVVSIVDAVGEAICRQGLKRVLLTGIKYTMQNSFYPEGLKRMGIQVVVPGEEDQDVIERIIFDELVLNRIEGKTRARFKLILDKYDVEGVILGCTELPLLLQQEDYDKPLFDSLDLHCSKILECALEVQSD